MEERSPIWGSFLLYEYMKWLETGTFRFRNSEEWLTAKVCGKYNEFAYHIQKETAEFV